MQGGGHRRTASWKSQVGHLRALSPGRLPRALLRQGAKALAGGSQAVG